MGGSGPQVDRTSMLLDQGLVNMLFFAAIAYLMIPFGTFVMSCVYVVPIIASLIYAISPVG